MAGAAFQPPPHPGPTVSGPPATIETCQLLEKGRNMTTRQLLPQRNLQPAGAALPASLPQPGKPGSRNIWLRRAQQEKDAEETFSGCSNNVVVSRTVCQH